MDSNLDYSYDPYTRNEEFESWLDECHNRENREEEWIREHHQVAADRPTQNRNTPEFWREAYLSEQEKQEEIDPIF